MTWKDGTVPFTGHLVQVFTGATLVKTVTVTVNMSATQITGLVNGTPYTFKVAAVNSTGASAYSAASKIVTPGQPTVTTVPSAPVIGTATQGKAGGALTAVATWTPPASTGGSAIKTYTVTAWLMMGDGVTAISSTSFTTAGAAARSHAFTLPAGSYRFEVVATNAIGDSPPSPRSNLVQPR